MRLNPQQAAQDRNANHFGFSCALCVSFFHNGLIAHA